MLYSRFSLVIYFICNINSVYVSTPALYSSTQSILCLSLTLSVGKASEVFIAAANFKQVPQTLKVIFHCNIFKGK